MDKRIDMDKRMRVALPDWLVLRRTIFLYMLVIPDEFKHFVDMTPEGKFSEMAAKYMKDYLEKGDIPPPEIAPAIFNLVDDQLSGRDLTIRSGDYISLQNYLRKNDKEK